MTSGKERADSFQDHKFRGWACRQKSCPTGHRRGNCRCVDLDGGCFGGHLQKDRTTGQIEFARSLFKTKNRVRAESRYRQILESQFRTRFHACAHPHSLCDFIVHDCRTRRALSFHQAHVLDYLGHARLLRLVCADKRRCANEAKQDDQSTRESSHKRFFHIGSLRQGGRCVRTQAGYSMGRYQCRSFVIRSIGPLLIGNRHLRATPKNDQVCVD